MGITRELYETISTIVDDKIKDIKVRREDLDGLHDDLRGVSHTVDDISKTQHEVEARVGRLETVMIELVEAQKRTDQSLTRLAEAQARTEVSIKEMHEEQRLSRKRMDQIDLTLQRVGELMERNAAAVDKLSHSIDQLGQAIERTDVQVGQLSDTIGFGSEDIAIVMIPGYLQRHFDIEVKLEKKLFRLPNGQEIEVDLYGEGRRKSKSIVIIGETKSRVKKGDVIKFDKKTQPLVQYFKDRDQEVLKTMLGYWIHPDAQAEAQVRNMIVIASYQR